MKTIIELRGLTKKINGRTIVDDIHLSIKEGEVFGLLGPNGAGKTTTIRMMVGLIKPSQGDVQIAGYSVKKSFEKAIENIGAVVENPEMYSYLTGYENLVHFSRMHKGIKKKRMLEVIQLVGLEERIHDKVKTYSLGMRQRLGLAQALLHKPKVLILDEPTNGLDPAGIREMRDYLNHLAHEENIAVIVSSHLLSEMEKMCDRIAIMNKGCLVGVESVEGIVRGKEQKWLIYIDDVKKAERILNENTFIHTSDDSSITLKAKREDIPFVVHALVNEGCNIYEISPVKKASLEEEFLMLTGGVQ
ncbi:ABC transporter ATP-binding protein [Alteribacter aurantiacus]|uniref:ABC transporter ATP-binding protein n=1 Tax=Alteribacter aurantiacus TaxID=254410 RepID=UPI0003FBAF9E|nr:ABC transporter ATP-binding protein [Alteribacter aurantiacus]